MICVAVLGQGLGRRIPFAFLDDLKQRFISQYGTAAQHAAAYEFNTEFAPVIAQRMDYFSNDPNADTINRVRGGVAEVKNIMIENIEKVQAHSINFTHKTAQISMSRCSIPFSFSLLSWSSRDFNFL
jgi:Regulated-SNARE-like domain